MQVSDQTDLLLDENFKPLATGLEVLGPSAEVAEIVDHLTRMVAEYGNGDPFDPREWVNQWLDRYVPALGGQPRSFLGTAEGRKLVKNALDMSWSGAYA